MKSAYIIGVSANTPYGRGLDSLVEGLERKESSIKPSESLLAFSKEFSHLLNERKRDTYIKQLEAARTSEISEEVYSVLKEKSVESFGKLRDKGFVPENFHDNKLRSFLCDKLNLSSFDSFLQLFESESVVKVFSESDKDVPVVVGTSSGTSAGLSEVFTVSNRRLPSDISRTQPELVGSFISSAFCLTGPNYAVTNACASSLVALGHAWREVCFGYDNVVVLGVGEGVSALPFLSFMNMGALSKTGVSKPYDVDRNGFVIGEGVASMFLSSKKVDGCLGEVLGVYSNSDGDGSNSLVNVREDGRGLVDCVERALDVAGLYASDVDYICSHGTSTVNNDHQDVTVYRRLFGESAYDVDLKPSMFSLKGYFGHTTGASGLLEIVSTIGAYGKGFIPYNFDSGVVGRRLGNGEVDSYSDVNLVLNDNRRVSDKDEHVVLKTSAGFGGHNSVAVLKLYNSKNS